MLCIDLTHIILYISGRINTSSKKNNYVSIETKHLKKIMFIVHCKHATRIRLHENAHTITLQLGLYTVHLYDMSAQLSSFLKRRILPKRSFFLHSS